MTGVQNLFDRATPGRKKTCEMCFIDVIFTLWLALIFPDTLIRPYRR